MRNYKHKSNRKSSNRQTSQSWLNLYRRYDDLNRLIDLWFEAVTYHCYPGLSDTNLVTWEAELTSIARQLGKA